MKKKEVCALLVWMALTSPFTVVKGGAHELSKKFFPNGLPGDGYLTNDGYKENVRHYDLSAIFLQHPKEGILGYIGDNFQRLWVHFNSVTKDEKDPFLYHVKGKTKVKENICDFTGTIIIEKVAGKETSPTERARIQKEWEAGEGYDVVTEGRVRSKCLFAENAKQKYSGFFEGDLLTDFYVSTTGAVLYNEWEEINCDSCSNNQFVGSWKMYQGHLIKKCAWGDFRIPMSDGLDIGAGEFVPDVKYVKNGWESYQRAFEKNEQFSEEEWWK